MTVYVSTGGFGAVPAHRSAADLVEAGIGAVELSGGRFAPDLIERLAELRGRARFQVHNYFPPPAQPFVLNLGSLNPEVARQSVEHVERALSACVALGADRYSFHAGFLLDPRVDELGKRIARREVAEREAVVEAFVARVSRLAQRAADVGVALMVENNVLSARNRAEFDGNPLLMCDPEESAMILDALPTSVGMLMDVAHLKVSAQSLGFDPARMFAACATRIAGYHLSDNDGSEDSNWPFDGDAWFWKHLDPRVDYCSIEVYGRQPGDLQRLSRVAEGFFQRADGGTSG